MGFCVDRNRDHSDIHLVGTQVGKMGLSENRLTYMIHVTLTNQCHFFINKSGKFRVQSCKVVYCIIRSMNRLNLDIG